MNQNTSHQPLKIGYGRIDITPDYPVNLAGSAAIRVSEGALEPIYLTFIAIAQGEERFLVATMDLVGSYSEFTVSATALISKETGVPEEHIILNATHTHSSVSYRNLKGLGIDRYDKDFKRLAVECAKAALADLTPATLSYGNIMTEGMVWVRHYKIADGTFAGANYGTFKPGIVGHASDPDPEMQLIRFHRAEGKKDVVLMNFPAHATINQKSQLISTDFPGPARDYVAEKTDTLVAYFIAGGGDQVPISRVPEENFSKDYTEYGREVGRLAVEGLKKLTPSEGTALRFVNHLFVGESNKADLDRAEDALAVKAIWDQVGGRSTPEGKEAAKSHGFSSVYAVTAILNRMKFPAERSMKLKALAIGEVSLFFAPYEMFGSSAMQVKAGSPFPMSFAVSCSQDHQGYLPSKLGCKLRCYEAQITKFAYGTAETAAEEFVSLLTTLKNEA